MSETHHWGTNSLGGCTKSVSGTRTLSVSTLSISILYCDLFKNSWINSYTKSQKSWADHTSDIEWFIFNKRSLYQLPTLLCIFVIHFVSAVQTVRLHFICLFTSWLCVFLLWNGIDSEYFPNNNISYMKRNGGKRQIYLFAGHSPGMTCHKHVEATENRLSANLPAKLMSGKRDPTLIWRESAAYSN